MAFQVVCSGEILFDCLPKGIFLGGAPLNVAVHLARHGVDAAIVSAVGEDFLGREALERVAENGVSMEFVRKHVDYPTGTVKARIGDSGNAEYTFAEDVAWDHIAVDAGTVEAAREAKALVYGTLAMREEHNREALGKLLALEGPLKILDVNLRSPYDDLGLARELSGHADLVKLNEDELAKLSGVEVSKEDPLPAIEAFSKQVDCQRVCLTLGERGAFWYDHGHVQTGRAKAAEVRDTVGAGDAFLAALVTGLLKGEDKADPEFIERCARVGAFVASQDGATPAYDPADLV